MRIEIPKQAAEILGILEKNGYEGYVVGGCVRDAVMGRTPHDWDITTSASPKEIKRLFQRTADTGIQHGTVTVLMGKEAYEVTTYRVDGAYEDGRHPTEVIFTKNLEEDLKRRDFTMNAMAYSESGGLVDIFGGMDDIRRGQIRCVGNAEERFGEDALRMLRAVRFSAQLGFEIEPDTAAAIRKLAGRLSKISAERVQAELVKMMESAHPAYLRKAWELGITAVILPEFDRAMETPQNHPHHCMNVGEHILAALEYTEADKYLRFAALFHDLGKPAVRSTDEAGQDHFYGHAKVSADIADEVLHRLKFDNETIRKVKWYVLWHDVRPELTRKSVRKAVSKIGAEAFGEVLKLKMADTLAQHPQWQAQKKQYLAELSALYQEILESRACLSIRDLAVNGKDLLADGMQAGKEIGEMLALLLEYVLERPEDNQREILLAYSRRHRSR